MRRQRAALVLCLLVLSLTAAALMPGGSAVLCVSASGEAQIEFLHFDGHCVCACDGESQESPGSPEAGSDAEEDSHGPECAPSPCQDLRLPAYLSQRRGQERELALPSLRPCAVFLVSDARGLSPAPRARAVSAFLPPGLAQGGSALLLQRCVRLLI